MSIKGRSCDQCGNGYGSKCECSFATTHGGLSFYRAVEFDRVDLDSLGAAHHFDAAQTQCTHDDAGRSRDENRGESSRNQPGPVEGSANDEHESAEPQQHPAIAKIVAGEFPPTMLLRHI